MALWRLMTPTLAGSSASAGSGSASPTIGKMNDALFTTDSLQESVLCLADYFGGAAGLAAGTAGLAAGGRAIAGAGAAEAADGAFLSYSSMISRVMSMVLDAYITGVCGELMSRIRAKPLSLAYLSSTT